MIPKLLVSPVDQFGVHRRCYLHRWTSTGTTWSLVCDWSEASFGRRSCWVPVLGWLCRHYARKPHILGSISTTLSLDQARNKDLAFRLTPFSAKCRMIIQASLSFLAWDILFSTMVSCGFRLATTPVLMVLFGGLQ